MKQLGSHQMDINDISYLKTIRKSVHNTASFIKTSRRAGTLNEELNTFIMISPEFFVESENL